MEILRKVTAFLGRSSALDALVDKHSYLERASRTFTDVTGKRVTDEAFASKEIYVLAVRLRAERLEKPQDISDEYLRRTRALYDAAVNELLGKVQISLLSYESTVVPVIGNNQYPMARDYKNKPAIETELETLIGELKRLRVVAREPIGYEKSWSYWCDGFEKIVAKLKNLIKEMAGNEDNVVKRKLELDRLALANRNFVWGAIGAIVGAAIGIVGMLVKGSP